jgi:hypothetical protein
MQRPEQRFRTLFVFLPAERSSIWTPSVFVQKL